MIGGGVARCNSRGVCVRPWGHASMHADIRGEAWGVPSSQCPEALPNGRRCVLKQGHGAKHLTGIGEEFLWVPTGTTFEEACILWEADNSPRARAQKLIRESGGKPFIPIPVQLLEELLS